MIREFFDTGEPAEHDPVVIPFADAVDHWVVRCPCGYKVQFMRAEDAEADAQAHMDNPDEPAPR